MVFEILATGSESRRLVKQITTVVGSRPIGLVGDEDGASWTLETLNLQEQPAFLKLRLARDMEELSFVHRATSGAAVYQVSFYTVGGEKRWQKTPFGRIHWHPL